jgi:hypothetical protein
MAEVAELAAELGAHPPQRPAAPAQLALVRLAEAGHHPQQRRLAAAIAASHLQQLAALHGKVEPPEQRAVIALTAKPHGLQQRHGIDRLFG